MPNLGNVQLGQIVTDVGYKSLGSIAREEFDLVMSRIQAELDSPLRLHATHPVANAVLNLSIAPITLGDGAKRALPPVKSQVYTLPASTINFQTQATSGATFVITWPASIVGQFRRAGLSLLGNGTVQILFSAEAASVGALANPGTVFVKSGVALGYIDLQCTNVLGYFKTAGSATDIIENAAISRFSAGSGGGSGSGDANSFTENLKHRLGASYYGFVTPAVFESDEAALTSSATATFDIVNAVYAFSTGNSLLSTQLFDSDFLNNDDDSLQLELHAEWLTAPPVMPAIQTSLDLDFSKMANLDSRITFTRASTATRVNSKGLIETVGVNVPRFDYNPLNLECKGLLLEESRTNLMTYSDFTDAQWGEDANTLWTTDTTLSPFGVLANKLYSNSTASAMYRTNRTSAALATASVYTLSFYAKAAEREIVFISAHSLWAANQRAFFNLSTLVATVSSGTGTASILPAGNGWYRCSLTTDATTSAGVSAVFFGSTDVATGQTHVGIVGAGAYFDHVQIELGTFATSAIPTQASTVVRSADTAAMTGTNFSSWHNQSEGTIVLSGNLYKVGSGQVLIALGNPTLSFASGETMYISPNTSTTIAASIIDGGVSQMGSVIAAPADGDYFNIALAYKLNNSRISLNANSGATDAVCTMPTPVGMSIGSATQGWSGATSHINGHISKLTFYPVRIADSEISAVTENVSYELSIDGSNFETVDMEYQGRSAKVTGSKLMRVPVNSVISTQAGGVTNTELNATTRQAMSAPFTLASKNAVRALTLEIDRLGTAVGSFIISIKKDIAGVPGDTLYSTIALCSTLSAGLNSLSFSNFRNVLPIGNYHVVIETDATYKSGFSIGVNSIRIRTSASTGNDIQFNGTVWSVGTVDIKYALSGHAYDLRFKVTSYTSKSLKAFGVFYNESVGAITEGTLAQQRFIFSGDLDTTSFALTRFLPDPDHMKVYDVTSGQVYMYPAFTIDGHNVVFPVGTFLIPASTINLLFDQSEGVGYDYSAENANLLAANKLGSSDTSVDKSVSGRGILIRNSAGQLRELWLDSSDNLNITAFKG